MKNNYDATLYLLVKTIKPNSENQLCEKIRLRYIYNSKVNGTSKSVYLPISILHSILTVPNLLAHNL